MSAPSEAERIAAEVKANFEAHERAIATRPLHRDSEGRFVCSRTRPLLPGDDTASNRVVHEGAREVGDSDYSISYRCRDCGTSWSVEMPG